MGLGPVLAPAALLAPASFDSPALGGGGRFVRLGGVGAAPGCGGGGLISSPDAALDVTTAGAYLACTVAVCAAVAVGVGVSVGPGGRAPGCGAGYVDVPLGGGAVVVVAS